MNVDKFTLQCIVKALVSNTVFFSDYLWTLMNTTYPIVFVDHLYEGLTRLLTQKYALVLDVPRADRIAASYHDRVYTLIPFMEQKTYIIITRHDVTSAQQLNVTMETALNELSTLRRFDNESVRDVFSNIPAYLNGNSNGQSDTYSSVNGNGNVNGNGLGKQSMDSTHHTADSIQLSNANDPDSQTPDESNDSDNDNDNELTVNDVMDGAALTSGAVGPPGVVIHSVLSLCCAVVLYLCVVYL